MTIESRLRKLEDELGEENREIKLDNGNSVYLTQQDALEAYVDALKVNIGTKGLDEAGDKMTKLLSAEPDQDNLVAFIQGLVENREEH